MEISLLNKNVLITGATGQLGRVMAITLAGCGANVAVHYHSNKDKAVELQSKINSLGRKSIIVQADITDKASVGKMKDAVTNGLGNIDILVINAVSQYNWEKVMDQSPEDYLNQFNSCVMQSVLMTQAFVPQMIEKRYGRVIGINTECSMQCFPHQSAYAAAKRGMDGILRVLAKEVGEHQITVNQIAPGWTISDRDRINNTERSEGYEKFVPLKRRGTDQEIANVVAFMASDLSSNITGAFIPVCGGNVMPAI